MRVQIELIAEDAIMHISWALYTGIKVTSKKKFKDALRASIEANGCYMVEANTDKHEEEAEQIVERYFYA